MGLVLLALFIALPFAELAAIVAATDAVGLGWTFVALVGFSILGAWLVRHEGSSIWRAANAELAAGRMPARQLLDGVLVLTGGALLLTPGFITDLVGLAMLFPPTRMLLRPLVLGFMTKRAVGAIWMPDAGSRTAPTEARYREAPTEARYRETSADGHRSARLGEGEPGSSE